MPQQIPVYPVLFKQSDQKSSLYIRPSIGGHGRVAEISVSLRTAQALRTQIETIREFPDFDTDPDTFELAAEAVVALAAPDLVQAIRAVLAVPNKAPTLFIIKGLQVCNEPVETPVDGVVRLPDVVVEAAILVGVMRHFGLSGCAFASENDGRLLRAVCPVPAVANTASSQGANADLTSHSDNGHLAILGSDDSHPVPFPVMNAFQFFTTVTPDARVPMRVKLNDDVIAKYDPRGPDPTALPQFKLLFEDLFEFASPPSHGQITWTTGLPILVQNEDPRFGPAMRLHGGTTRALTPAATEALDLLKHAVAVTREESIYTRRGDIVGYVNTAVTHRREPFEARYDGSDRYYLRVYGNARERFTQWIGKLRGNGRIM